MGEIIYWTLLRTAVLIPAIWYCSGFIDYRFWWILLCLTVYLFIIYPAIRQLKKFEKKNKQVVEDSLCTSCRHFDVSAVLCMKYDKHPTAEYLPCDGKDWEPENK